MFAGVNRFSLLKVDADIHAHGGVRCWLGGASRRVPCIVASKVWLTLALHRMLSSGLSRVDVSTIQMEA